MCGICGQYHFSEARPASQELLRAMSRSIAHRGPDDEGYHRDGALGLGFRRLSIIDLAGGHQPMSDPDGLVWVVFNGEIFNFPELRTELLACGHHFRTNSDTEVLVHGYRQWGVDVLQHLNGMFGLAIWDATRRRLVLARDAAGIKPVYYHVEDGTVVFGSELRAVLAARGGRPPLDATALNLLLRFRYVPAPWTVYEGVRKLAPGEMAVFENGGWALKRWYRLPAQEGTPEIRDDEAIEELDALYRRALKRHLLSDVPVGLLLSGGIDSGLLLGLMNLYGGSWPTYTIGYGRAAYKDDELQDAARTARLFGARHCEVDLTREAFETSLARTVAQVEEPVASSSIVSMFHVCERARQDVKVALVGQGPDELFGGYVRHVGVRCGEAWRQLPGWMRRGLAAGLLRLPRNEALKRGVRSLSTEGRLERYRNVFSLMPGPEVDALFRPDVLSGSAMSAVDTLWDDLAPEIEGRDELSGFQVLELRSSLPDELLMFTDKLSMAHGLEVRVPYLDREVFEFAMRLPARMKVRFGQRKWLHRQVCRRFLPSEVLRRKKRGFGVDAVDGWLQASMGGKLSGHLLDRHSLIYDSFDPEAVRGLLVEHQQRRHDHHKLLFTLVALEEWLRAVTSPPARSTSPSHAGPLAAAAA